MDYEKLANEKLLKHPKRLKHTYGVVKRAKELGSIYKADLKVLETAAFLHDITKHEEDIFHKKLIADEKIISNYPKQMWHAFSAAKYAIDLGIKDKKIIEAIKYHIFGKIDMNVETMILVVSDFCEEGRKFPLAKEVYKEALNNLTNAYLMAVEEAMIFVVKKGLKPLDIQKETYLYYKERTR